MDLLDVLVQKFAMKVTSNCVVDESFLLFALSSCLVAEDHIIIPAAYTYKGTCRKKTRFIATKGPPRFLAMILSHGSQTFTFPFHNVIVKELRLACDTHLYYKAL